MQEAVLSLIQKNAEPGALVIRTSAFFESKVGQASIQQALEQAQDSVKLPTQAPATTSIRPSKLFTALTLLVGLASYAGALVVDRSDRC